MAVTSRLELAPLPVLRWPDPAALDPELVRISYNDDIDTLYVRFPSRTILAAECPLLLDSRSTAYATVEATEDDELTGKVVGVMVEGIARFGIHERPSWAAIAEFAGLPGAAPDSSLESLKQRRSDAIQALINDMATLPLDEGVDFEAAVADHSRAASRSV